MKLNIFSKEANMRKDEITLTIATVIFGVVGTLLLVFKPSILFLDEIKSATAGVMLWMITIIFLVCVIYRFRYNSLENKDKKED